MRHFNPTISEDKARILNLKSGDDTAEVLEYITPTIEIKPINNITRDANVNVSGAGSVIYTTPTDKDFYITGVTFSYTKDVACDTATGKTSILATINGTANRPLISLAILTLTAEGKQLSLTFSNPIKIDRGTNITFSNTTYAAGSMVRVCNIYGYTIETLKGV